MSDPRSTSNADQQPDESAGHAQPAGDTASDEMLLLGARMQDRSALTLLYDRHSALVYTLALRVVADRALAEAVMQDVFLRCWHGQDEYDATRGTLSRWLLSLTRRCALDLARELPREASLGEPATRVEHADAGSPTHTEDVVLRALVSEALAGLSEPQRDAIELAYYGGLTQAQVAERLGEPEAAVKTRLRDGLLRLRRVLAPVVEGSAAPEHGTR